jgi:predicted phosphodiesterase
MKHHNKKDDNKKNIKSRRGFIKSIFGLTIGGTILGTACKYDLHRSLFRPYTVDERITETDVKPLPTINLNDPDNFTFIIGSDTHFTKNLDFEPLPWIQTQIQQNNAEFLIVGGDLTDHGLKSEWENYIDTMSSISIPILPVLGNHDLFNDGWLFYKDMVGPSYYLLDIGRFTFCILDSASGGFGNKQINMLEEAIKDNNRPKIMITHYPLIDYITNMNERSKLINICRENNFIYYLAGHRHSYKKANFTGFEHINISGLTNFLTGGDPLHIHVVSVSNGTDISISKLDFSVQ